MLLTRYATEIGNAGSPIYQPSPAELAIMALKPSRWFEARTDRGLALDEAGNVKSWVDRARGVKYRAIGQNPTTTGTGTFRRVNFNGNAARAMLADDASDAFDNPGLFSVAILSRQTEATFGGAPMGTGGDNANASFAWYNAQTNGAFFFFTGAKATSSGAANNDSAYHVHVFSMDLSQGTTAAQSRLRRDGVSVVASPGPLGPLADMPGGKTMTLGGAGRTGTQNPYNGSLSALIVIPNVALHLAENADSLAVVESYLTSLIGQLP